LGALASVVHEKKTYPELLELSSMDQALQELTDGGGDEHERDALRLLELEHKTSSRASSEIGYPVCLGLSRLGHRQRSQRL
jgi:hypothetical protein